MKWKNLEVVLHYSNNFVQSTPVFPGVRDHNSLWISEIHKYSVPPLKMLITTYFNLFGIFVFGICASFVKKKKNNLNDILLCLHQYSNLKSTFFIIKNVFSQKNYIKNPWNNLQIFWSCFPQKNPWIPNPGSTVYQVEENGWINEYMLAVHILDFLFLYTHLFWSRHESCF